MLIRDKMCFPQRNVIKYLIVRVSVDGEVLGKTAAKPKTSNPVWNEIFTLYILAGSKLGMTIFHKVFLRMMAFIYSHCLLSVSPL